MLVDVYHPPQRYGLIYTDPPWPQKKGGFCKCRPNMKSRELDYPVMELSEIVQFHSQVLPILAEKKHNVFMWVIEKYLIQAEEFMNRLGYIRHARIIWNKRTGVAPAFTVRFTCEYLLWFYNPGNMLMPIPETRGKYATYLEEVPKRHSQKPECAYRMLEEMFAGTDKIELFARNTRSTWDCWGNDAEIRIGGDNSAAGKRISEEKERYPDASP